MNEQKKNEWTLVLLETLHMFLLNESYCPLLEKNSFNGFLIQVNIWFSRHFCRSLLSFVYLFWLSNGFTFICLWSKQIECRARKKTRLSIFAVSAVSLLNRGDIIWTNTKDYMENSSRGYDAPRKIVDLRLLISALMEIIGRNFIVVWQCQISWTIVMSRIKTKEQSERFPERLRQPKGAQVLKV